MIGGGDGVAALMLGQIHGSIRDLNQFLRSGAVERIAGDAETGADILLAKQRIGGNPAAQFGGKLAGLLHGGFRHQDDEFVSTVAGHDIGAAAVGFQDLANALENQVAFQVAVEIVHELEAVQIHQDESEGTPGARRAFPF